MIVITMMQEQEGRGTAFPGDLTQRPVSIRNKLLETPGDCLEVIDALEWILCMEPEKDTPQWQRAKMAKGRIVIADLIHDLQRAARS